MGYGEVVCSPQFRICTLRHVMMKTNSVFSKRAWSPVALGCVTAVFLTGCIVKRDEYDLPALETPANYRHVQEAPAAEDIDSPATMPQDISRWWRNYGSEELNQLVEEGLANNYELKAAIARISQAKALAGVDSAEEWPEISASAEASGQSPEDGIASLERGEDRNFEKTYQVGVEASYEVDLWGKNRARTQAALERAWASVFDRETVALSLASDIVRNYIEYLSLNDRIVNAEWTQETLTNLLNAVEERVEGGEATAIQLAQQQTAVANSKSVIPVLELQRELRINRLALLLGKSPSEIEIQAQSLVELKFPDVKPGVPSRLILRRPDLRRNEANLIAADADIDVARAELFPTPILSAEAAYGANSLSLLFRPESFFFSVGAAVTQAIFDAGRRQSQIKFEEAQHAELVHNYAQSIYTAINEVENALVSVDYLTRRRDLQDQAVGSAKEALAFATEAYEIGAVDYLTLLDTERTLFTERDEYHQVEFDRFSASVDLYAALGGDVDHTLVATTEKDSDKESRPPRYFQNEVAYSPVPNLRPNLPKQGHWVHLASLWGERAAWRHWRRMEEKYPTILDDLSPQIQAQQDESIEGNWVTVLLGPYPDIAEANSICAALLDRGEGCRTLTR